MNIAFFFKVILFFSGFMYPEISLIGISLITILFISIAAIKKFGNLLLSIFHGALQFAIIHNTRYGENYIFNPKKESTGDVLIGLYALIYLIELGSLFLIMISLGILLSSITGTINYRSIQWHVFPDFLSLFLLVSMIFFRLFHVIPLHVLSPPYFLFHRTSYFEAIRGAWRLSNGLRGKIVRVSVMIDFIFYLSLGLGMMMFLMIEYPLLSILKLLGYQNPLSFKKLFS